jgi:ammonia channel protein AmtB
MLFFFPLTGGILGPWTNAEQSDMIKAAMTYVDTSYPWSPALGPNTSDHMTGVFFFAFALFAMTTASILSGALIERVKIGAYLGLAEKVFHEL